MSEDTMVCNIIWEDSGSVGISKMICHCGYDFIEESEWDNITLDVSEKRECPNCGTVYKVHWDVHIEEEEEDE